MIDLGTLKLGIKVDSDSAKSQLGQVSDAVDDTGEKTRSLGEIAKSAIKAFAAAYAVKALVSIGKAALDAYASFEQLEGGVNKIFGDSAQSVIKNAEKAYKTAGLSANQYMEQVTSFSASLIQSVGGDTAKAAKVADMAIQDMADNANTFGTSMEAIQNAYQGFAKQNYTMLDNLKLGYGGTKTEMERLLKDAEKLSGIKYDINNLNDVYSAIHVIQTELNVTGTTAKEAASTVEGSMNSLKAAWENTLTALGTGQGLSQALANLETSFINVLKNVSAVVVRIAKGIIESAPALISAIADLIIELADSIAEGDNQAEMLAAGVKIVLNIIEGLIKCIPKLIEAGVKLIAALLIGMVNGWKTAGQWVVDTINQLVNWWRSVTLEDVGRAIINGLLSGLKSAWNALANWVSEKVSWITNAFNKAKKSGSHRIGLETVPYDNYSATLHKGEMVLTAAEANQYEKYLNGMNDALGNFSNNNSLQNCTIEVVSVLDGKIVAKATAPLLDKILGSNQTMALRGV